MGREKTLREFLRDARSRIAPESLGLPLRARRRGAGLSADEVAELVGVSDAWYSRVECGRAKLSFAALQRLASVLRLDDAECSVLFRLARPEFRREIVAARSAAEIRDLVSARTWLRQLLGASSLLELYSVATATLAEAGTHDITYVGSARESDGLAINEFLGWSGPRGCEYSQGMTEVVRPTDRPKSYGLREGVTAIVPDMYAETPVEAEVARERRAGSWSAAAFQIGGTAHFIGFAESERRQPPQLAIARLELIANMCEAAAS